MTTLFLTEAAKKADREFGVSQQSGKHTVREATTDITKHLTEHQVTTVISGHTTLPFMMSQEMDGKTYQVLVGPVPNSHCRNRCGQ